jgi:hypothetical protein
VIKFFRHIRKRLIGENRFSKYLLYAIGEIILVVIGILIALQINNWNSNRMDRLKEKEILSSLSTDFQETRVNLLETLRKQNRVVDYCNKLVKEMRRENMEISFDSLGEYMYRGAFSYWRIEPVNGTYDALIGSGNTSLIKNQELIQLLAKFSAEVKFGFEDETMAIDLTSSLVDGSSSYASALFPKVLQSYLDWEKQFDSEKDKKLIIEKHMNNDEFLGTLIMKYGLEKNRLDYQNKIFDLSENIIAQLETELAKTK